MTHGRAALRRWTTLRADDGTAAVEFAVLLPVLFVIVMGVVDFGRVMVTAVAVAGAAKAGAQYGAQGPYQAGDTVAMNAAATSDFGTGLGTLTVSSERQCRCGWDDAAVVGDGCATLSCAGIGVPRVFTAVTGTRAVQLFFRYPGLPASIPVVRTATVRMQ